MPEDTIASAAWRTWASVIPHPKLFQLFHPSGGVSAGLPGAAVAVDCAEAVTDAVTISATAVRRRNSRPPDRLGTGTPSAEKRDDSEEFEISSSVRKLRVPHGY
ncbi:hypothetical protein GCM10010451_14440 [Streptomyces virens]|uniref:Uncharacterized protein n=1 Tax=Streptomyces virens TaxID=285572 RepID=A0ABP6P4X7_9ACTN